MKRTYIFHRYLELRHFTLRVIPLPPRHTQLVAHLLALSSERLAPLLEVSAARSGLFELTSQLAVLMLGDVIQGCDWRVFVVQW